MRFEQPLLEGTLIRRYKRFLADVELADGSVVTAHCANSGSMATCKEPGRPVMLLPADSPKRKLKYTWELYHSGGSWVGVNTHRPNALVAEAIAAGEVPELAGYASQRREVKYGRNSRIDILLEDPDKGPCHVEVKNCTLLAPDGAVRFPDAVTERGRKHLDELMELAAGGGRAVMFFLVNRADGEGFGPADHIDPAYGERLREAAEAGVELLAYRTRIAPEGIELAAAEPIDLGPAHELAPA
ncbi:MAG: DNA/RNA nuclease SfsA [Thiohalorhabdus sp.]|uniref:DNA/RNA nuclease SfsA n=1 Tax=Thiohalorhabdus sp. TaxID=3094134 RepID=UPI00397EED60